MKRSWGWLIGLGYRRGSAAPRPGQCPDTTLPHQNLSFRSFWRLPQLSKLLEASRALLEVTASLCEGLLGFWEPKNSRNERPPRTIDFSTQDSHFHCGEKHRKAQAIKLRNGPEEPKKSPEMVREEPRKGSGMVWEKAPKKAQKWSGSPKRLETVGENKKWLVKGSGGGLSPATGVKGLGFRV